MFQQCNPHEKDGDYWGGGRTAKQGYEVSNDVSKYRQNHTLPIPDLILFILIGKSQHFLLQAKMNADHNQLQKGESTFRSLKFAFISLFRSHYSSYDQSFGIVG